MDPATGPPPLHSPPNRQFGKTRLLALAALLFVTAAGSLVFLRAPSEVPRLFPPCVWYAATGTHCPGCGITRALHELLRGRVFSALDYNAVGLLVLLSTATVLVRPTWIALRYDCWVPPRLPRRTAAWLFWGGMLWAVLRNLPWVPFTALAP